MSGTYYQAVGGLTAAAVIARREIKRDPSTARKVLTDALKEMEPHLHDEQTRAWIREEMKR